MIFFFMISLLLSKSYPQGSIKLFIKGATLYFENRYTTLGISYIIHTFSKVLHLFPEQSSSVSSQQSAVSSQQSSISAFHFPISVLRPMNSANKIVTNKFVTYKIVSYLCEKVYHENTFYLRKIGFRG